MQTEFADIASTETDNLFSKPESNHLSMDYKCMKWLPLDKKVSFLSQIVIFICFRKIIQFCLWLIIILL